MTLDSFAKWIVMMAGCHLVSLRAQASFSDESAGLDMFVVIGLILYLFLRDKNFASFLLAAALYCLYMDIGPWRPIDSAQVMKLLGTCCRSGVEIARGRNKDE